jgi:AAA15 family ATPase/GTPase
MIERLKLANFMAFEEADIQFSPRINVIIGENGCGKTQLLKAAYAMSCAGQKIDQDISSSNLAGVENALTDKLMGIFKPSKDKLGILNHRGSKANSILESSFSSGQNLVASFSSRSSEIKLNAKYPGVTAEGGVFIPTKEVISFLDGFSNKDSDQPTLERLFDMTYFDLVGKLLRPVDEVEEKAIWAFEKITNYIGGKFDIDPPKIYFRSGEFKAYKEKSEKNYFAATSEDAFSPTMTAEGFRKVGVLQSLLEKNALGSGRNGPLFWDEPEANMNPKLMRMMVEVLLELSRSHQQVIVATHDYVLLKWFALLKDDGKGDHVRFHILHREPMSKKLKLSSTDEYLEIKPNPISDAFRDLTVTHAKQNTGMKK